MASGSFINRSIFTPQRFLAMPSHMKTEAVLLAAEFGMGIDVIAASIDLSTAAVRSIMRARHCHALLSEPDAVSENEMPPTVGPSNRMKILRMMRRLTEADGITRTSTVDIAESVGIRTASVARAVRYLIDAGHVICVAPGGPKRQAQYRLSEEGLQYIAGGGR